MWIFLLKGFDLVSFQTILKVDEPLQFKYNEESFLPSQKYILMRMRGYCGLITLSWSCIYRRKIVLCHINNARRPTFAFEVHAATHKESRCACWCTRSISHSKNQRLKIIHTHYLYPSIKKIIWLTEFWTSGLMKWFIVCK